MRRRGLRTLILRCGFAIRRQRNRVVKRVESQKINLACKQRDVDDDCFRNLFEARRNQGLWLNGDIRHASHFAQDITRCCLHSSVFAQDRPRLQHFVQLREIVRLAPSL